MGGWNLKDFTLGKKVQRYFSGKADRTLGLDIGTEFIKVVQVCQGGKQKKLTHFGIVELPGGVIEEGYIADVEKLAAAIRQCLMVSRANVQQVNLSLGGRQVFSREISLPDMPYQELSEAVKWSVEEYVPYENGSFYYDFDVLGRDRTKNNLQILLVAAAHTVVNPLLTAVKQADLQPIAIETEPLALVRTGKMMKNLIFVDVGAQLTQVTIVQEGAPLFTRIIPFGGRQFTQRIMDLLAIDFEEADQRKQKNEPLLLPPHFTGKTTLVHEALLQLVNELVQEIQRTADYFTRQNNEMIIDAILVTGGGSLLRNLLAHLSKLLEVPVIAHNPIASLTAEALFAPQFLQEVAPSLAVAIGLAMRGDDR